MKYLKYAMGEIILVVIGILIALQINNWNEGRKELKRSKVLLEEFKKDIERDTIELNYVFGVLKKQLAMESWALKLVKYNQWQADSLWQVLFRIPYFIILITDRTYLKLQNSENPNLNGFLKIQNELTTYYTDYKRFVDDDNQDERHNAYENEINKVLRSNLEISLMDFPMLAQESEQQIAIINLAQSLQGRNYIKKNHIRRKQILRHLGRTKEKAKDLIQLINPGLAIEK